MEIDKKIDKKIEQTPPSSPTIHITTNEIKRFYSIIRDIVMNLDDPENDELKIDPLSLEELKTLKKEAIRQNKDFETYLEERVVKIGVKELRPKLGRELSQMLS